MEPEPAVYLPREVAALLRCDVRTVRRMVERGELAGVRIGSDIRVTRKSVEALLSSAPLAPRVLEPPKAKASTSTPARKPRKAAKGRRKASR